MVPGGAGWARWAMALVIHTGFVKEIREINRSVQIVLTTYCVAYYMVSHSREYLIRTDPEDMADRIRLPSLFHHKTQH